MTGGWIQGKPVTALMRQLMDDARDEDLLVADDTQEFYASLILERWGWLKVRHELSTSLGHAAPKNASPKKSVPRT